MNIDQENEPSNLSDVGTQNEEPLLLTENNKTPIFSHVGTQKKEERPLNEEENKKGTASQTRKKTNRTSTNVNGRGNRATLKKNQTRKEKAVRFASNVEYNEYLQNVFRDMPEPEGLPSGVKETFIERVIVPEGKTLKQLRLSLISQSSKLMQNVSQNYDMIVSYLNRLLIVEQMIQYQKSQGIEISTMKPKRNMGATRPPVNPVKKTRECPEGQEVSARTGRCIKKCTPPQVRNPETGRCKKP